MKRITYLENVPISLKQELKFRLQLRSIYPSDQWICSKVLDTIDQIQMWQMRSLEQILEQLEIGDNIQFIPDLEMQDLMLQALELL